MTSIASLHAVLLTGAFLIGGAAASTAQTIDFARVVPPLEANAKTLADYLVQQAWANAPERRALEAAIVNEDERVNLARRSWMEQLNFNFNFASQQQEYQFIGDRYQAPGGNVGVALNLGSFVNNKARTRLAQNEALITRAELDEQLPEVRNDVMMALETIEMSRQLLRIRRRAEVEAETNSNLVKSLYEQGKAQFQDVAQASEVYYQATAATVVAQSNLEMAQIELRTLTGLTQAQIEEARRRYAVR